MTVTEACEHQWDKTPNFCNVYAAAVADELLIFLPGTHGNADWVTRLVSDWVTLGPMMAIPPGWMAAAQAIRFANDGHFVLAGATAAEINAVRKPGEPHTPHGHLAVVTPGIGKNGWPRGYWKSDGGKPHKNETLSLAFRAGLFRKVHYFVVLRSSFTSPLSLL